MTTPEQQIAAVSPSEATQESTRKSLVSEVVTDWEATAQQSPDSRLAPQPITGQSQHLDIPPIEQVTAQKQRLLPPGDSPAPPKPTRVYSTSDGGVTSEYVGYKETKWPDGTIRTESSNGTGQVQRPTPGGGYTIHAWGPEVEDNWDATVNKDGHGIARGKNGDVEEQWPNGDRRVTKANGSGESVTSQPDGSIVYQDWDENKKVTYKRTEWPDGSYQYQREDGIGQARMVQPDKSVITKTWGPNQSDNEERTEYPDGSVKVQRADGTGFHRHSWPGAPPNHYSERHWGPRGEDNYLHANNGGREETVREVDKAYNALPKYIKDLMGPTLVVTADKPSRADSRFASGDGKWLGAFQGGERQKIVVTDEAFTTARGPAGLLRHEAGHNIDRVLGYPSQKKEFIQAFTDDLSKMPAEERAKIDYYWKLKGVDGKFKEDMPTGASQMYAEVFRVLQTPEKERLPEDRKLLEILPTVTKLVQQSLIEAQHKAR